MVNHVIRGIDIIVSSNYSEWYIGVTNTPDAEMLRHGHPTTWHMWQPKSFEQSYETEKHFRGLGMQGDPAGFGGGRFVYIFKP